MVLPLNRLPLGGSAKGVTTILISHAYKRKITACREVAMKKPCTVCSHNTLNWSRNCRLREHGCVQVVLLMGLINKLIIVSREGFHNPKDAKPVASSPTLCGPHLP